MTDCTITVQNFMWKQSSYIHCMTFISERLNKGTINPSMDQVKLLPFMYTSTTDRHDDVTEILLKVALNAITLTLYIYSILLSHSLVCFQLIQGYMEYYSLLSKILELWLANDTSIKTHTWTLLITTPDTLFYSVESLRCLHSLMVILLMSINTWLFNEDILIVNILWMEFLTYLFKLSTLCRGFSVCHWTARTTCFLTYLFELST